MTGEKIEVNVEVLESEITNLNNLLNEINSSGLKHKEVEGKKLRMVILR